ncbi:fumarate hydratase C-terminal domain-containing protein [Hoeflea sp. AS16]
MSNNEEMRRLSLPLSPDTARSLKVGERVILDGEATVTVGYPTHQRMVAAINAGDPLPIDLTGGSFFHMGTCCYEKDGRFFPHYVNPTTSTRFDALLPTIVRGLGITAIAGKGGVGKDVVAALKDVGGVYFAMPGGAAPMLSAGVVERLETGWDDLIEQFRLSRFSFSGFGPLIVGVDAHGNSLYQNLSDQAEDRLPAILARLKERRTLAAQQAAGSSKT